MTAPAPEPWLNLMARMYGADRLQGEAAWDEMTTPRTFRIVRGPNQPYRRLRVYWRAADGTMSLDPPDQP